MDIITMKLDELKPYENNPRYCDVIIQRWEQATGHKAVRIDDAARS